MDRLTDLTTLSPQEWDERITCELNAATIGVHKFRDYDSPNFSVKHTLKGRLGQWSFIRDETVYGFWGDVPLATAEVIASDPDCAVGCMPKQWFTSHKDTPNVAEVHANFANHVVWMNGTKRRVKDENFSEQYKRIWQHEANGKLLFVDNPSAGGKPYIQTYTFFTEVALIAFMTIVHRHRVDYISRYVIY